MTSWNVAGGGQGARRGSSSPRAYRRVGGSKIPRALSISARGLPSLTIRLRIHSLIYS